MRGKQSGSSTTPRKDEFVCTRGSKWVVLSLGFVQRQSSDLEHSKEEERKKQVVWSSVCLSRLDNEEFCTSLYSTGMFLVESKGLPFLKGV